MAGIVDLEGVIRGLGAVGLAFLEYWQSNGGLRQAVKRVRRMLRNPGQGAFRSEVIIARAIHDHSPDHANAIAILKYVGARPNLREDGSETWIKESNWQWTADGHVSRTPDGSPKLKWWVRPTRSA